MTALFFTNHQRLHYLLGAGLVLGMAGGINAEPGDGSVAAEGVGYQVQGWRYWRPTKAWFPLTTMGSRACTSYCWGEGYPGHWPTTRAGIGGKTQKEDCCLILIQRRALT